MQKQNKEEEVVLKDDFDRDLAERELKELLVRLDERKRHYSILDTKVDRIPQQKLLFSDFIERLNLPIDERARFYLYY